MSVPPDRSHRPGRFLVPALVVLLAGGIAAALRTDPPVPPPLVATADDEQPDGEVRVATPPELDGLPDGDAAALDVVVRADVIDLDAIDDELAGARYAAPATALDATTPSPTADAPHELVVLGVESASFRPLAPEVTATAPAVWQRLDEGDAIVTHELAEELDLELGSPLVLRSGDRSLEVRIGAFAANGAPAIADVLVPLEVARGLGVGGTNTLLVAAAGDPVALGQVLAAATGGEIEQRPGSIAPIDEERTTATPPARVEPLRYTSQPDGSITIHDGWVARNIDQVQLPGMAETSCHRVVIPQLLAAVEELQERDLYDHLDPTQFAGCFVARHIDRDPTRALSLHAWGLAIDFNAQDNPLGATPVMDPDVVEVFERWGFDWGGHWRRPDGMHFELARIVPTG